MNSILKNIITVISNIYIKISKMVATVRSIMSEVYSRCTKKNVSGFVTHCLYDHEMDNVSIYVKTIMAIIAAATTVFIIVRRAEAARIKRDQL